MPRPLILIQHWLPDGELDHLAREFTGCDFVPARSNDDMARHLGRATVVYGLPPVARLGEATSLRWIQLASAGVPMDLCAPATKAKLTVTNLAGLYGPTIAEHALALMLILSRNLHVALCNKLERRWDRSVAKTMTDLHGKTLALVGVGNIGQHLARLGKACGMRTLGCRRLPRLTPCMDRIYPPAELRDMLAEADYVAVTAPLTCHTEGMLGSAEFAAMKRGVIYINVSRGSVAQEKALLEALQSGQVAAAGLDVFAVEPLPPEHPFWSMPQVFVSPHFSGETVNQSSLPVERFKRNLRTWLSGGDLEGRVNLEWGY
jgi:phosphoglycerate dehydrogenase-like enzyme